MKMVFGILPNRCQSIKNNAEKCFYINTISDAFDASGNPKNPAYRMDIVLSQWKIILILHHLKEKYVLVILLLHV